MFLTPLTPGSSLSFKLIINEYKQVIINRLEMWGMSVIILNQVGFLCPHSPALLNDSNMDLTKR